MSTVADAAIFAEPKVEKQASSRSFLPDPAHLWLIFRRRIWVFLFAAGLVAGLVTAYTLSQPALYSATATVLIEPRAPQMIQNVEPVAPGLAPDSAVIDTEVQILSSRRLAGRVAESLDLSKYPQFRVPAEQASTAPGTHPLAASLLGAVDIRRAGLTYLINIEAAAPEPDLAAAIANGFAREYLEQQTETKNFSAAESREFLQSRINELRDQAAAADAALQRYKIANGLMSAEGATMAEQEVSVLNQEIAAARAILAEKAGQLAAARSRMGQGGGGADLPATLQSGTVGELRTREAVLSGRLADVEARYGDRHPEVRRVRDELADTREQLQRQIDRVIASLESDVNAARSRVASLEASQSRARGTLASNNSAQVGYLELERNAEAARSIYQAFLNRSREMVSQEGLLRPDARIESLARVPLAPFSPNYPLAALFGLIGAVVAGLGAVATAEYLDARIRTRADVEQRLQVPYAGAIPDLHSTLNGARGAEPPRDYLVSHPYSSFAEAFRSLKTVLLLGGTRMPTAIAVTSALPREGKSTTAVCLARTMAMSGMRTVLIDCDARRRSASEQLLPEGDAGLVRFLDGSATLDEALVRDEKTDLQILGMVEPPPRGSDLFSEGQLENLLAQLRERFHVIIIDTAPVLGIAETRTIAAAADYVLLLGRWRMTSLKAADTSIDLLLTAGAKLRGLALTLVNVRKYASTGQEDVYHYHKKFAGYYAE